MNGVTFTHTQYFFYLARMITLFAFPVNCTNLENLASLKTLRTLLTGGRAGMQELTSSLQLPQQRNCSDVIRQSTRPHQSCQGLKRVDKKMTWTSSLIRFVRKLERWQYQHNWVGGSMTYWGCERRQSHVRHFAAKKNFCATEKEEISSGSLLKGLTKRFILR